MPPATRAARPDERDNHAAGHARTGTDEAHVDHTVIGRLAELARIGDFLAAARTRAHTLLVEGEPGMGKTTLWLEGAARAEAAGMLVLAARPSGAEATFAWAAIGDLLEAVPDAALDALPPPQARALRVALLREAPTEDAPAPDPRAVAVALRNALVALAADRPVLVAVDDIGWLDSPSALALGFAIRRLRDEPCGFLLARRIEVDAGLPTEVIGLPVGVARPSDVIARPSDVIARPSDVSARASDGVAGLAMELDRLPADAPFDRLRIGPMDIRSVGRLVEERLGLALPREDVRRIHATSLGNPFYALELARAAGGRGIDAGLALPDSLRRLVGARVAGLPAPTREALAVAAALAHPKVARVAEAIGATPAAIGAPWAAVEAVLAPAIDAHVVEVLDGRLQFTHPLLRSAAWEEATPGRRREIHARLAAIVGDQEERARHLALSADGPDASIADALEEAAAHARARGAPGAAADLAGLARRLTPADHPADALRRGLAEGEHALVSGDAQRARSICEQLLSTSTDHRDRARVSLLLATVDLQALDLRAAVSLLREALRETDDDRVRMRCEGLLTAALDDLEEDVPEALAHGLAELEIAERLGDTVHVATALRGIARNEQRLSGRFPAERMDRAMALEPVVRAARSVFEWPSICLAEMHSWTDDVPGALGEWEVLRQAAMERGEEPSLGWILARQSGFECVVGRFDAALAHVAEGLELAAGSDHPVGRATMLASRAFVRAHLGDEVGCRRDAEGASALAAASGVVMAERTVAWALGLLELSLGDAAAAHAVLGPLVTAARAAGIREPGAVRFVPDEVEALVGTGRLDEAEALLDPYTTLARSSGRLGAWAAADRARGLLLAARGDGAGAIEVLGASRELYGTVDQPFGLGRTLLALGAAQRRALRRRDARATLEAAVAVFERLGAVRWAETARRELGAISGRQAAGEGLTAAEQRVAELVAAGRTNREVAATLFLTERTIESHLSHVYAKLGIRSRAELAAAWSTSTDRPPPA
ncbi:MAG: AAA family ATPase [Chloroflexota bacterium]